jgi:hypothetical protein
VRNQTLGEKEILHEGATILRGREDCRTILFTISVDYYQYFYEKTQETDKQLDENLSNRDKRKFTGTYQQRKNEK